MSTNRTEAIIGIGTTLSYSATQGGSYTAIGELVDVKMPEVSAAKAEATHYESPSNTKEFKAVPWKEYADVDFEINYEKSRTTEVNGLVAQEKWYKVTLPDASVFNFPAFVSKFGGEIPNQGKISQKGSITIIGAVTFTEGA